MSDPADDEAIAKGVWDAHWKKLNQTDNKDEARKVALRAKVGEVWQENDGVLLLCVNPGVFWFAFGTPNVDWYSDKITYPLHRMLDANGNLVPEYKPPHFDHGMEV